MPPKTTTKAKQAAKSRGAATQINPNATVKPGAKATDVPTEYRCTCCGSKYKIQKSNFPRTSSPLYAANDGYLTICKTCIDEYYDQLVGYFTGNEEKAIDRVAQIADWYYSDEIWATTRKISADRSRVSAYPSKMQLQNWKSRGTTYLDTIRDRASVVLNSYDEFEDKREQGETGVTKAQIARWGLGFEESEYRQLDAHYKSLQDKIDVNDVIQDNLARDLCEIKIQQIRARNKGDAEMFQKFTKLYQETLKSANLKVNGSDTNSLTDAELCWGNFIRDVERFMPAEIYQDRTLYADADSFKSYLERFVLRPVRNFFTGSRDMDPEFSIGGADGDEE